MFDTCIWIFPSKCVHLCYQKSYLNIFTGKKDKHMKLGKASSPPLPTLTPPTRRQAQRPLMWTIAHFQARKNGKYSSLTKKRSDLFRRGG